jgi:membrane protease YdiL (CAAX protease family)
MSNDSSKRPDKTAKPQAKFATVPLVPWNPWLALVFAAILFYFAQIASAIFISIYPRAQHWTHAHAIDWLNNSIGAQFVFVLLAEAFMVGGVYLFLKRYQCSFKIIGLKRPRWSDWGYGLLAVPAYYLFYLLTVGVVSHFAPGLKIDQQQQIGFNDVQGVFALVLTFLSLVVLPALAEEIMVRGFLYSSLKKALPTAAAAVSVSLLFAVAHLPEGGAAGPLYIAALDTFVLSLILIYLREKTGNLWSSITLHAFKNGVAFVVLFILKVH